MKHINRVLVEQLKTGMILAEDVFDNRGNLILAENMPISEKMIMRLKLYAIETIGIYMLEEESNQNGFFDRTPSDVNQEFKQTYLEILTECKETIDEIVYQSQSVNQEHLLDNIDACIDKTHGKIQLFQMLRNLKEYDNTIYTHCLNVAIICKMFGIWLNKSESDIAVLTMGGLLHDIGKLAILQELTGSEDEMKRKNLLRKHPQKGYDILRNYNLDERIPLMALEHHERRNKSGYPKGLGLNEINEFSQIVAIADIYDEMTLKKEKDANSPLHIIEYFQKEGYDLFESNVLLPLIEKTSETYLHNKVILTNGVEGEIIMLNPKEKNRPLIRTPYGFIDLSMERGLEIVKIL